MLVQSSHQGHFFARQTWYDSLNYLEWAVLKHLVDRAGVDWLGGAGVDWQGGAEYCLLCVEYR